MAKRRRSQKSEVRSQKSEVRSQKSEGRSQKAEGKRQEAKVGQSFDLASGEALAMPDNLRQETAAVADFVKPPVDLSLLTPRQLEVLRCFVDTPHEPPIAHRLGMRVKTVERHLYNIQQKLQVTCRVELMKVALFALRASLGDGTTIRESLTTKTSKND